LGVWKKAVEFCTEVIDLIDTLQSDRKHYRIIEQLESAVTSIALNIAEGKGRYSKKEFIQFLYYARGSLFETITLIEIFKRKNWISIEKYDSTRMKGSEIGKMLSSLINSIKKSIITKP
jgi:four helix bundle protein